MIKLSQRLACIAGKIRPGERVADVGTDHGYVPIHLYEEGISPLVILTDISAASLAKAKGAAGACQFGGDMQFRVGSGLSVLSAGEVDAVIIAGMGGKLIRDILSEDPELTLSFHKYVFQPRTASGALRKWLLERDFRILSEDIVEEGQFLPEIITAVSPAFSASGVDLAGGSGVDLAGVSPFDPAELPEDDIRLQVPPWILRGGGPVRSFIERRLDLERQVAAGLAKARNVSEERIERQRERIVYLEELLRQAE